MRRSKIADGDSNAAIVYLEGKAAADPMAMARYNLTEDGMLANMFWVDGISRVDYQYFGDVVAFDSTYKKNKYNRPLVIFSGSNNHKQTTIFGFGLVLNETITLYTWMLENLLEVMCNKPPSIVVTDGDDAMITAVKKVFPEATHRLCAWHLQKNVTSNGSEQMFREIFSKWLYVDMEVDKFEFQWDQAANEYDLHKKCWATQMYEKRYMWASAYLRDKFCVGYRTTSRCEGINSHVKKFLTSRHSIVDLVQNLELVVHEYRNNEFVAQFTSMYSTPVFTTYLDPIEKCAVTVYTRAIFMQVKREIDSVGGLNFVSKRRVSTTMVYTTEEYGHLGQNVVTLFENNSLKFECQCRFWEKEGFPCKHMFFVMKHEHLKDIPRRLILKRWRRDAKAIDEYEGRSNESLSERGAPRLRGQKGKKRRCTNCKKTGHTKRRCLQRNTSSLKGGSEDNEDDEESVVRLADEKVFTGKGHLRRSKRRAAAKVKQDNVDTNETVVALSTEPIIRTAQSENVISWPDVGSSHYHELVGHLLCPGASTITAKRDITPSVT
ncbi:protein FAR1-RELATED SEQUENCE 5-like [Arachis duranensis]|uniref:Protein FAR1-RELATED SEQUENCE 5-like n=1 Tax=Arachis duranensis TaxID=130453 RepID=A0A6P4C1C4_ARADU|nr:protein FAR1-RELATED SEQUENCE 5-like [Arachis duranensis]